MTFGGGIMIPSQAWKNMKLTSILILKHPLLIHLFLDLLWKVFSLSEGCSIRNHGGVIFSTRGF
jgi:hypothetical protein